MERHFRLSRLTQGGDGRLIRLKIPKHWNVKSNVQSLLSSAARRPVSALREGTVIADQVGVTPCVFLAGLHRAERTIADRLTRLANGTLPWPWIDFGQSPAVGREAHRSGPG